MSKILKPLPYYKYSFYNELVVVNVMESNHTRCLISYISTIITLLNTLLLKKVEDIGVEPMTPCVQGRCSSQLS